MSLSFMRRLLSFVFLIALGALGLRAQSDTAVVFGVVKDPSGATVAGARIQLRNEDTGVARELKADDKGLFYFMLLPPGNYGFVVEAEGFKQYRDSHVRIHAAPVGRS